MSKKRRYIVVGYFGADPLRWCVGVVGENPFETTRDVALFSSRVEAKRYARRLNAGKPGVP